jgi:hypothetical protein
LRKRKELDQINHYWAPWAPPLQQT